MVEHRLDKPLVTGSNPVPGTNYLMNTSKNIVGVLGFGGDGGTFIDWSMHYLTGQTQHYHIQVDRGTLNTNRSLVCNRKIIDLIDSPVTKLGNAHLHQKTHPTIASTPDVIKELSNVESALHTFYTVAGKHDNIRHRLANSKFNGLSLINSNYTTFVNDYKDVKFIRTMLDENSKLLFNERHIKNFLHKPNHANKSDLLTGSTPRPAQRIHILGHVYATNQYRINRSAELQIGNYENQYILNFSDISYRLDDKIKDLIGWIGLELNTERLEKWRHVYAEWQKSNGVHFYQEIDSIVEHIVNGHAFDLTDYDLNVSKETALIYKLAQRGFVVDYSSQQQMPLDTAKWNKLISIRQD